MQCPVCGTLFDGRFCPQCGTAVDAARPASSLVCRRCGTTYTGNFCPACGAPAIGWGAAGSPPLWQGVPPYGAAPRVTTVRSFLSYAWLAGIVVFVLLLASNYAVLGAVTPTIVDGIRTLTTGSTPNPGLDSGSANWTFLSLGGNVTGGWSASGGNPGGFLSTRFAPLPSQTSRGVWSTRFNTAGSSPFAAVLRFDFQVLQMSAQAVSIEVFVETVPGRPFGYPVYSIANTPVSSAWTAATKIDPSTGSPTNRIDLGSAVQDPATYYLKLLISASFGASPSGDTVVGLDNVLVRWGTRAALNLFLLLPPVALVVTRDQTVFLAYYALIAVSLVAALAVQLAVDVRPLTHLLRLPPEDLAGRLRARVGFTTLAQVFLASFFFQVMFILILNAVQVPTPSFLESNVFPPWYIVFSLANASVFEEVISRLLLIGLPLFAASLVLRTRWLLRYRNTPHRGRYLLGSFRYLYGGNVTRDAPLPTLIGAGILLAFSSALFGLAHAPGYGDWKILPAAVGGLALGYLYLRHGLATAILAHFAQDYFAAIFFVRPVPIVWAATLDILFLAAMVVGAGFFAYYLWYIGRLVRNVAAKLRGPAPVPAATGAAWPNPYPMGFPNPPATPGSPGAPPVRPPPIVVPPGYAPPGRPPPYGFAPVQFRCSRCGWIEARYDEGRFTCLRCGHTA